MTYCVGMLLDAGMIFASDSRTNAGVDNIARFSKMKVYHQDGDRTIVVMSAGNLSVTQNALSILELRERNALVPTLFNAISMFDIATILGESLRDVRRRDGPAFAAGNIDASASFIVGGQIQGERPRLFLVYSEGNFIEATGDTPYFQIGEIKYGKPILDRVVKRHTPLVDAAKCTLVSFDSTMRSNLSVGMPIDLLMYETDSYAIKLQKRIEDNDEYFQMIHNTWGDGLREVFRRLPDPTWV
ncbi:peptidase [Parvibium lacunae]|uniref:Peptidase n=2 Tax=Parvibium lacunae TaxID=1888893 RepID=A0A368L8T9_9BURK|nr:peptidase [Parvibium lacunae]